MNVAPVSSDISCLVDYIPVDSVMLASAKPADRVVADARLNITLLAQFASNIDISEISDAKLRQDAINAIREVRQTVEELTPLLKGLMILPEDHRICPHPSFAICAQIYRSLVRAATELMKLTHPRLAFILAPACTG